MFCTTLRQRKEWAPALASFKKGEGRKWQGPGNEDSFRFVVLSSADLASPHETDARVDRLCSLTGGSNVGLAFLLGDGGDTAGFTQLQLAILSKFDIPLIPVHTAASLPQALCAFHQQLSARGGAAATGARPGPSRQPPPTASQAALASLLPYCTLGSKLREHAVNVLSDTSAGFRDLVAKAGSEEGRAELVQWLGADVAENVVRFWMQEYTAR